MQHVVHRNSIPALDRGACSVAPVNLNVYLGNNLKPLLPFAEGLGCWNSMTGFFLLLISRKIPGFLCSRMVSLTSVCTEPGCLGGSPHVEVSPCAVGHGRGKHRLPKSPDWAESWSYASCWVQGCLYCMPCKNLGDRSWNDLLGHLCPSCC